MKGSLDSPPIVIRADRGKSLLLAAGSLAFVALDLGLPPPAHHGASFGHYAGAVFFSLGLIVGVWQLVAPARLELAPGGFSWTVLGRSHSQKWDDVKVFQTFTVRFSRSVGWNYAESYPHRAAALRKLNVGLVGLEAGLPGGWEVGPDELVKLLSAAQSRWSGKSQPASNELQTS